MTNFWQGFEKQSGWKNNAKATALGVGTAGAMYGISKALRKDSPAKAKVKAWNSQDTENYKRFDSFSPDKQKIIKGEANRREDSDKSSGRANSDSYDSHFHAIMKDTI